MTTMRFRGRSYRNGCVPSAVLDELRPHGRHGTDGRSRAFLRKDAAASWNRAVDDVRAGTGLQLTVRGWNRSLGEQQAFFFQRYRRGARSPFGDYRRYDGSTWGRVGGAAAAVPGYSNHGWALAVDVQDFGGVGEWGNPRRAKAYPILREHGWTETEGRRVNEPWHLVYCPAEDRGARRRGRGASRGAGRTALRRPLARSATLRPHRPPTLRRGSRRPAWVRLWAGVLAAEGVYAGALVGTFDDALDRATRTFQGRADVTVDGIVGPQTWYSSLRGVKPGSRGPAVRVAQVVAGLRGAALDGVAGSVFAGRWKRVQRWLGVAADAEIGPRTVAALLRKG
ncbi:MULTISPECIES: peptidoglycan-binding protein [unclassified Isoptericola]|uniref:peptidoglycan-binding protein n=1 Tax=unclassified Isoptericola TaxID=2623355 RepID=UPI003648E135